MKKFPILKIPDVVFREVTSMMTPTEIMKLSMSDFKLELLLRNRKCKINVIIVQTGNIHPKLDTSSEKHCLSVFFEKSENDKRNPVTHLAQLQDTNLTRLFSYKFHYWALIADDMKPEEVREYTAKILTLEFQRFSVHAKTMSNDLLTELVDKIPQKMEFVIESNIALDYSHPKALKFPLTIYTDARWLKVEDLLSIRNLGKIKLKKTNFDCSDVNKFIQYWSDCDEDMIEAVWIKLKEGTQIDEQQLIKNLIVISDISNGQHEWDWIFMKPRNMGNRKFVVGQLEFRKNEIIFSANDPLKGNFSNEYSILELVHQKRDCEEKIRKMEKEFRGLRDAEKKKLQMELKELERKLTDLNRDYEIRNVET
ncbi:hypothetical protein B9Z55_004491 [Caenorhabditis nigoni]|uniref:F-box associated domain-containing protein n=1 Tax=Caenorhabditis nigoni TaxID=1611254 RepID=A0A2G5UWK6_9PELO|nr:hypothetical protein B9Z55_004491 [Caenorhabditis nigoni]